MNDTIGLLQSCHRGTITAVNTLEHVMEYVQSRDMQQRLKTTLKRHQELGTEVGRALHKQHVEAADPNAMARMGVWMTTEMRMMTDAEHRDQKIAHLIINGCNTGIQALSGDVNRYGNANGESRALASSLVREEEHLMEELRTFL